MKEKLDYITNLRFPLIFGVVMDHASLAMPQSVRGDDVTSVLFHVFLTLAKISVPVFFIISGFLFFKSVDSFCASCYIRKLRSRLYTLFVPYILWTLVCALYIAVRQIPVIVQTNSIGAISDMCTWRIFWMYKDALPLHSPLWYIRDLILLCLCSPVIWIVINRFKHLGLCLLFVLFMIQNIDARISFPISIFYFSFGAYLSICNIKIQEIALKLNWGVFLVIILAVICSQFDFLQLIRFSHIVLAASIVLLSCFITGKLQCRVPRLLTDSVFFVYVTHCIMFVMMYNRIMIRIIPDDTFTALLFIRWGIVGILTTTTCIMLYIILNKFFPKTVSILTGSR